MMSERPVDRAADAVPGRGADAGPGAVRGGDGLILYLGGIVYVILYTKYAFNFILVWI